MSALDRAGGDRRRRGRRGGGRCAARSSAGGGSRWSRPSRSAWWPGAGACRTASTATSPTSGCRRPQPQSFRPADTGCFDDLQPAAPLASYAPFDCRERHVAEAFFVGDLTGDAAAPDAATTPGAGASPAHVAAGQECARRATPFLGAEWRTGQLRLQPVLPGAGRLGGRRPLVPLRRRRGRSGHGPGGEPHRQPARRPRRRGAAGADLLQPDGRGRPGAAP